MGLEYESFPDKGALAKMIKITIPKDKPVKPVANPLWEKGICFHCRLSLK